MSVPHIRVVAAEVERDGAYLITQRRPEAELPLLWEFPGGRVREGESDGDALRRTLRHRLDVDVQIGHRVLHVTHAYEGYTLDMVVYRCSLLAEPRAGRVHALQWVRPEDFGKYRFPGADQQTVDALLRD
ncbi:MAG: (deoxy)nucleoside triphosphate pyrophosphohydrolase [Myxococcota bacterium]